MSVLNLFSEDIRFTPLYPQEDFERDWRLYEYGQSLERGIQEMQDNLVIASQDKEEVLERNGERLREIRARFRHVQKRLEDFEELMNEIRELAQEIPALEREISGAKANESLMKHKQDTTLTRLQDQLVIEKHKLYRKGLISRAKAQTKDVMNLRQYIANELR